MNERDKEIWEKSQQWDSSDDGRGKLKILESIEKFAQLIVAECARVILETPVDYEEIDTMHRIRDRVKKHFGVEE